MRGAVELPRFANLLRVTFQRNAPSKRPPIPIQHSPWRLLSPLVALFMQKRVLSPLGKLVYRLDGLFRLAVDLELFLDE